jgi:TPR repeat protein
MLADMMLTGRGGAKDHETALSLFLRAAERGHVGAMFAVGAMYGGGHEVQADRVVAQRWFEAAAGRGHPRAQLMLGRYLARNLAGVQDVKKARRWLERALAQGIQDAKTDLATLLPPLQVDPQPAATQSVGD